MNPRKRTITIIGVIIILLLGAGVYYFFIRDLIPSSLTSSKEYSNTTYNYSFSYPGNYTLTEFSPEAVAISLGEGEAFSNSVTVNTIVAQKNDPSIAKMNGIDFAIAQAQMFCNSDGTISSATCPKVAAQEEFKTKSGLVGKKISFVREVKTITSDYDDEDFPADATQAQPPTFSTETGETAPFYIFDVSNKHPENAYTIIMVSNPLYADLVTDSDKAFAQAVAKSLEVK